MLNDDIIPRVAIWLPLHQIPVLSKALFGKCLVLHDFSFAQEFLHRQFLLKEGDRIPPVKGKSDVTRDHPNVISGALWMDLGPNFLAAYMVLATDVQTYDLFFNERIRNLKAQNAIACKLKADKEDFLRNAMKAALATPKRREKIKGTTFCPRKESTYSYFRLLCALNMTDIIQEMLKDANVCLDSHLLDGYVSALSSESFGAMELLNPCVLEKVQLTEKEQSDLLELCKSFSSFEKATGICDPGVVERLAGEMIVKGTRVPFLLSILEHLHARSGACDSAMVFDTFLAHATAKKAVRCYLRNLNDAREIISKMEDLMHREKRDPSDAFVQGFLESKLIELIKDLAESDTHFPSSQLKYTFFSSVCKMFWSLNKGHLVMDPETVESFVDGFGPVTRFAYCGVLSKSPRAYKVSHEDALRMVKLVMPRKIDCQRDVAAAVIFICKIRREEQFRIVVDAVEEHEGMPSEIKGLARFGWSCFNADVGGAMEGYRAMGEAIRESGGLVERLRTRDGLALASMYCKKDLVAGLRWLSTVTVDNVVWNYRYAIFALLVAAIVRFGDEGSEDELDRLLEPTIFRASGAVPTVFSKLEGFEALDPEFKCMPFVIYMVKEEQFLKLLRHPDLPVAFLNRHILVVLLKLAKDRCPFDRLPKVLCDPRIDVMQAFEDPEGVDMAGVFRPEYLDFYRSKVSRKSRLVTDPSLWGGSLEPLEGRLDGPLTLRDLFERKNKEREIQKKAAERNRNGVRVSTPFDERLSESRCFEQMLVADAVREEAKNGGLIRPVHEVLDAFDDVTVALEVVGMGVERRELSKATVVLRYPFLVHAIDALNIVEDFKEHHPDLWTRISSWDKADTKREPFPETNNPIMDAMLRLVHASRNGDGDDQIAEILPCVDSHDLILHLLVRMDVPDVLSRCLGVSTATRDGEGAVLGFVCRGGHALRGEGAGEAGVECGGGFVRREPGVRRFCRPGVLRVSEDGVGSALAVGCRGGSSVEVLGVLKEWDGGVAGWLDGCAVRFGCSREREAMEVLGVVGGRQGFGGGVVERDCLRRACRRGDVGAARVLLENGIYVPEKGVMMKWCRGNVDLLKMMVDVLKPIGDVEVLKVLVELRLDGLVETVLGGGGFERVSKVDAAKVFVALFRNGKDERAEFGVCWFASGGLEGVEGGGGGVFGGWQGL
ncbi:hypothetical protein HDU97_005371 [Phlyctochytrium planicorne]|nr:hypothetical protein HDU97_005371 [Phlyctochytrium planicorne]